jgi:hypothetical protein
MKRMMIAVILAAAATAVFAQATWQRTSAMNFTFEMPGKPVYSTQSGNGMTLKQYLLDESARAFTAQTVVYPPGFISDAKARLQEMLDASGKQLQGGKWKTVNWSTFKGLPATDTVGVMQNKLEMRSFAIIKGNQAFLLTYGGAPGTMSSPDAKRFFESLTVQ